jgi:hypothetical protein
MSLHNQMSPDHDRFARRTALLLSQPVVLASTPVSNVISECVGMMRSESEFEINFEIEDPHTNFKCTNYIHTQIFVLQFRNFLDICGICFIRPTMHCHCIVIALSLHCHCIVIALSLHCHCIVIALPLEPRWPNHTC